MRLILNQSAKKEPLQICVSEVDVEEALRTTDDVDDGGDAEKN